ncbi:cell division protein ZapB [Geobacter pelophilus]|uniref:Cell division protein ZapB n=1 Tax=Geoanaerobacter pelophilus TaxID=60036 RepID=A0AAW4LDK9_9BACT|nr:cell division protein ZapB [Geoanaerobacter pelophilus]
MDNELITALEGRIEALLASYASLKNDNLRLSEENAKLRSDRDAVRSRVDGLLKKLENL